MHSNTKPGGMRAAFGPGAGRSHGRGTGWARWAVLCLVLAASAATAQTARYVDRDANGIVDYILVTPIGSGLPITANAELGDWTFVTPPAGVALAGGGSWLGAAAPNLPAGYYIPVNVPNAINTTMTGGTISYNAAAGTADSMKIGTTNIASFGPLPITDGAGPVVVASTIWELGVHGMVTNYFRHIEICFSEDLDSTADSAASQWNFSSWVDPAGLPEVQTAPRRYLRISLNRDWNSGISSPSVTYTYNSGVATALRDDSGNFVATQSFVATAVRVPDTQYRVIGFEPTTIYNIDASAATDGAGRDVSFYWVHFEEIAWNSGTALEDDQLQFRLYQGSTAGNTVTASDSGRFELWDSSPAHDNYTVRAYYSSKLPHGASFIADIFRVYMRNPLWSNGAEIEFTVPSPYTAPWSPETGTCFAAVKATPADPILETSSRIFERNGEVALLNIDLAGDGETLEQIKVRFMTTSYGQFDPAVDLEPLADGASSGVLLKAARAFGGYSSGEVIRLSTTGLEWSPWLVSDEGKPYREVTLKPLNGIALPVSDEGTSDGYELTISMQKSSSFGFGDSFYAEIPDTGFQFSSGTSLDEVPLNWTTPDGTVGSSTGYFYRVGSSTSNMDGRWNSREEITTDNTYPYLDYEFYDGGTAYRAVENLLDSGGVVLHVQADQSPTADAIYRNGDNYWYDIGGRRGTYDAGTDIPIVSNRNGFYRRWAANDCGARGIEYRASTPAVVADVVTSGQTIAAESDGIAVAGIRLQDSGRTWVPRTPRTLDADGGEDSVDGLVIETISKNMPAGTHTLRWDGTNLSLDGQANEVTASGRMLLNTADGAFLVVYINQSELPTATVAKPVSTTVVVSDDAGRDIEQPTALPGVRIHAVGRGNAIGPNSVTLTITDRGTSGWEVKTDVPAIQRTLATAVNIGGGRVRFSTTVAHGLAVGNQIYLAVPGSSYTGFRSVAAVTSSTTFDVAVTYSAAPAVAGGTVTLVDLVAKGTGLVYTTVKPGTDKYLILELDLDVLKSALEGVVGGGSQALDVYSSRGRTIAPLFAIQGLEIMAVDERTEHRANHTFTWSTDTEFLRWDGGAPRSFSAIGDKWLLWNSTADRYVVVRRTGDLSTSDGTDYVSVNQTRLSGVEVEFEDLSGFPLTTHVPPLTTGADSGVALYRDANGNGVFDGAGTDEFVPLLATKAPVWNPDGPGTAGRYMVRLYPDLDEFPAHLDGSMSSGASAYNYFVVVKTTGDVSYGDRFRVRYVRAYEPTELPRSVFGYTVDDITNTVFTANMGTGQSLTVSTVTNTVFVDLTVPGQTLDAGQSTPVRLFGVDHWIGNSDTVYLTTITFTLNDLNDFDPDTDLLPIDGTSATSGLLLYSGGTRHDFAYTAEAVVGGTRYTVYPTGSGLQVPQNGGGIGTNEVEIRILPSLNIDFQDSFSATILAADGLEYTTGYGSPNADLTTNAITATVPAIYGDPSTHTPAEGIPGLVINSVDGAVAEGTYNISLRYDAVTGEWYLSWDGGAEQAVDMDAITSYDLVSAGGDSLGVTFNPVTFRREDTLVDADGCATAKAGTPDDAQLGDALLPIDENTTLYYRDVNANGVWDAGEAIVYDGYVFTLGADLLCGTVADGARNYPVSTVSDPAFVVGHLYYIDTDTSGSFGEGEPVVQAASADGNYDQGVDTVLCGAATDGAALTAFVDTDAVVFADGDGDKKYTVGEGIVATVDHLLAGSSVAESILTPLVNLTPLLRYVDTNLSGGFDIGEPLVRVVPGVKFLDNNDNFIREAGEGIDTTVNGARFFDTNGDGSRDPGEYTVLPLTFQYVDSSESNYWEAGEAIVGTKVDGVTRFVDLNGDGQVDAGEPDILTTPITYEDANSNRIWTLGETVVKLDTALAVTYLDQDGTSSWTINAGVPDPVLRTDAGDGHTYADMDGNGVQDLTDPNVVTEAITFDDTNLDGVWNPGEAIPGALAGSRTFVDMVNPDGLYTAGEPLVRSGATTFLDMDGNGVQDLGTDPSGFTEDLLYVVVTDDGVWTADEPVVRTAGANQYKDTDGNGTQDAGEPNVRTDDVTYVDYGADGTWDTSQVLEPLVRTPMLADRFVDADWNGVQGVGEPSVLTATGDFFQDINDDGVWTADEPVLRWTLVGVHFLDLDNNAVLGVGDLPYHWADTSLFDQDIDIAVSGTPAAGDTLVPFVFTDRVAFGDEDTDGLYTVGEPVVWTRNSIRLAGPFVFNGTMGRLLLGTAADDDVLSAFALSDGLAFHDADGNGAYTCGEDIVYDMDGVYTLPWMDSVVDTDGTLTSGAGGATALRDGDTLVSATVVSVAPGGTLSGTNGLYYFDADNSGGYSLGDEIVLLKNVALRATLTFQAGDQVIENGGDGIEDVSAGAPVSRFVANDHLWFQQGGLANAAYDDGEDIVLSVDSTYTAPSTGGLTATFRVTPGTRTVRAYNDVAFPAPFNTAMSAMHSVLSVDVANGGDDTLTLDSLTVRFEAIRSFNALSDLRALLANSTNSGVMLYRDADGDGVFNAYVDTLVPLSSVPVWSGIGTVLNPYRLTLATAPGTGLNVISSASRDGVHDFFVVVQLSKTVNDSMARDAATGDQFRIRIDAGDIHFSRSANQQSITGATVTVDTQRPTVVSALAYDRDGNGFLDELVLDFHETLIESTSDAGDWVLTSADGEDLSPMSDEDVVVSGSRVTVALPNDRGTTGAVTYSLSYDGDLLGLFDAAGNPAIAGGVSTDQTFPVVLHSGMMVNSYWSTLNGTAGEPLNLRFHDRNGNLEWNAGEDIWADVDTDTTDGEDDLDGAGVYNEGIDVRVWNGGDAWTTPDLYTVPPLQTGVNVADTDMDGAWDAAENIWVDQAGGVAGEYDLGVDLQVFPHRGEEIEVLDLDEDGQIDALRVPFSKPIDEATLAGYSNHWTNIPTATWRLASRTGLLIDPNGPLDLLASAMDGMHLYFVFNEAVAGVYDTASTPGLTTVGATLLDTEGNPLNGGVDYSARALTVDDHSAPVLISAWGDRAIVLGKILAGTNITLTFSEPIVQYRVLQLDDFLTDPDGAGGVGASGTAFDGADTTLSIDAQGRAVITFNADTAVSAWTEYLTIAVNAGQADHCLGDAVGHNMVEGGSPIQIRGMGSIVVQEVLTLDSDGNGKIDGMRLTFDRPVDDSTLAGYVDESTPIDVLSNGNHWRVAGRAGTVFIDPNGPADNDSVGNNVLYLAFVPEGTSPDTGAKPALTVVASPLRSFDDEPVASVAATTDGAAPQIMDVSAYDQDGDGSVDTVRLDFSEGIGDTTIATGDYTIGGQPVAFVDRVRLLAVSFDGVVNTIDTVVRHGLEPGDKLTFADGTTHTISTVPSTTRVTISTPVDLTGKQGEYATVNATVRLGAVGFDVLLGTNTIDTAVEHGLTVGDVLTFADASTYTVATVPSLTQFTIDTPDDLSARVGEDVSARWNNDSIVFLSTADGAEAPGTAYQTVAYAANYVVGPPITGDVDTADLAGNLLPDTTDAALRNQFDYAPPVILEATSVTDSSLAVTFSELVTDPDLSRLIANAGGAGSVSFSGYDSAANPVIVLTGASSSWNTGATGTSDDAPNGRNSSGIDCAGVQTDLQLNAGAVLDQSAQANPLAAIHYTSTKDGVVPVIVSVTTADVNADGKVDQATVVFSEQMTGGTASEFKLEGVPVETTGKIDDYTWTLGIPGAQVPGTDYAELNYLGTSWTDIRGNALASGSDLGLTQTDAAPPLLLTASTFDDHTVLVQFSEPLENSSDEISAAITAGVFGLAAGPASLFGESLVDDGAGALISTDGQGRLAAFYLRMPAGTTWNTDATGTLAGSGFDSAGAQQTVTPQVYIAGGNLSDAVGNSLPGVAYAGVTDGAPAVVIEVTTQAAQRSTKFGAEDNVFVKVLFSEALTYANVGGDARLKLLVGATNTREVDCTVLESDVDAAIPVALNRALAFTYTVAVGDNRVYPSPGYLEYESVDALSNNGSDITDLVGNVASLVLPEVVADGSGMSLSRAEVQIDALAPTLLSARTMDDDTVCLTFDEPVQGATVTAAVTTGKITLSGGQAYDTVTEDVDNVTGLTPATNYDVVYLHVASAKRWNTDATGTDPGGVRSTDRASLHRLSLPVVGIAGDVILDRPGNKMAAVTFTATTDGAAPVVLSRVYRDSDTPELPADGRVDTSVLVFSEPVSLTGVGGWTLDPKDLDSGMTLGSSSLTDDYTLNIVLNASMVSTGVDGGLLEEEPVLSFDGVGGGIADRAADGTNPLGAVDVPLADRAGPAIRSAAMVMPNVVEVTFSEIVDPVTLDSVDDFAHSVAGIPTVITAVDAVPGSADKARLTLAATPALADAGTIAFSGPAVVTDGAANGNYQVAPVNVTPLGDLLDLSSPATDVVQQGLTEVDVHGLVNVAAADLTTWSLYFAEGHVATPLEAELGWADIAIGGITGAPVPVPGTKLGGFIPDTHAAGSASLKWTLVLRVNFTNGTVADVYREILVSSVVPLVGEVRDGLTAGQDIDLQNAGDSISANWSGLDGGVLLPTNYEMAVGTNPLGTEIKDWTYMGSANSGTIDGLVLVDGTTYYVSVRALDTGHHTICWQASDGVTVDLAVPVPGAAVVRDGAVAGDDVAWLAQNHAFAANWDAFTDPPSGAVAGSGVASYELAVYEVVGTADPGTADADDVEVSGFVNVGNVLWAELELGAGILDDGRTYYAAVRAIDGVGNISEVAYSDGATVDMGVPEPQQQEVRDGVGADEEWTSSHDTLSANWLPFTDGVFGPPTYALTYEYRAVTYLDKVETSWQTLATDGALNQARQYFTSVRLKDGRLLVAGGWSGTQVLSSTEIFDPGTMKWTVVRPMATPRMNAAGVLLPSGKVVVAGGENTSDYLASIEIYDPADDTWTTATSVLTTKRAQFSAVVIDGHVWFIGGRGVKDPTGNDSLASMEVFDPVDDVKDPGPHPNLTEARRGAKTVVLDDGGILVIGGETATGFSAAVDVYTPSGIVGTPGVWSVSSLTDARAQFAICKLPNGHVLVLGGRGETGKLDSVEEFDLAVWSKLPTYMGTPRAAFGAVWIESENYVLVAGGLAGTDGTGDVDLASCETYDPSTGAWGATTPLNVRRGYHGLTAFDNGLVLAYGGLANYSFAKANEWRRYAVKETKWVRYDSAEDTDPIVVAMAGLQLVDGQKYFVQVRAYDAAGNVSAIAASNGVTVDLTAPTAVVTAPSGPTNVAPLLFDVTFSEDVTGFDSTDLVVGNGTVTAFAGLAGKTFQVTVTPATTDGAVTLAVAGAMVTDIAGNLNVGSGEASVTFRSVGPTCVLSEPTTPTRLVTIPFTATFAEAITGFTGTTKVSVVNGRVTTAPTSTDGKVFTFAVSPYDEGDVIVKVLAGAGKDALGNASQLSNEVTVVYDATAPVATLTDAPTALTGSNGIDITVGGAGVERYTYTLDGSTESAATAIGTHILAAGLLDGPHTLRVWGIDAAGNKQLSPTTLNWTIDTVAPIATLGGLPGSQSRNPDLRLTVGGTGVTKYTYILDANAESLPVVVGTGLVELGLADGPHTIQVWGIDAANNKQGAPTQYTWTVDRVAPTAALVSLSGSPTLENPIRCKITFVEDVIGFAANQLSVNGTLVNFTAVSAREFTFGVVPGATMTAVQITVTAAGGTVHDAAGNLYLGDTLVVDYTPAVAVLGGLPSDPSADADLNVTVGGAGINTYIYSLDGGARTVAAAVAVPLTETGLADGPHTLQVWGVDPNGNEQAQATEFNWTVDTVAPTATLTSLSGPVTFENPIRYQLVFDEDVADFVAADLTVNGTVSDFVAVSAREYTFGVVPTVVRGIETTVTVTLAAGDVHDAAGNAATGATLDVLFYTEPPARVTLVPSAAEVTVGDTFNVLVYVKELSDAASGFRGGPLDLHYSAVQGDVNLPNPFSPTSVLNSEFVNVATFGTLDRATGLIDEFGGFRIPDQIGDAELEDVLYATIPFVAVKPGQFRMAAAAAEAGLTLTPPVGTLPVALVDYGPEITVLVVSDEVTLSVVDDKYLLPEKGGTSTLKVSLASAATEDVTVDLALDGTAVAGTDYAASATTVVITAGNDSATVTLTGIDDPAYEGPETIIASIASVASVSGAYRENGSQEVALVVSDDDLAPGDIPNVDGVVDGIVNGTDLGALLASYNKALGEQYYNPFCDLNGDDKVNYLDLNLLIGYYGTDYNPPRRGAVVTSSVQRSVRTTADYNDYHAEVTLEASAATVAVGDSFTVQVFVRTPDCTSGFSQVPMDLSFTTALADYDGVFKASEVVLAPFTLLREGTLDEAAGRINGLKGGTTAPGTGYGTRQLYATMQFVATASGTVSFASEEISASPLGALGGGYFRPENTTFGAIQVTVADPVDDSAFSSSLQVHRGAGTTVLTYGRKLGASDDAVPADGDLPAIALPDGSGAQFLVSAGVDTQLANDYRPLAATTVWKLTVTVPKASTWQLAWDGTGLPITGSALLIPCNAAWETTGAQTDLQVAGSRDLVNDGTELAAYRFLVVVSENVQVTYNLCRGWNLIGVPLMADADSMAAFLADEHLWVIYEWSEATGYTIPTTLQAGRGYWVYSLDDGVSVKLTGIPRVGGVAVTSGWNLVASGKDGAEDPGSNNAAVMSSWMWDASSLAYVQPGQGGIPATCGVWVFVSEDTVIWNSR